MLAVDVALDVRGEVEGVNFVTARGVARMIFADANIRLNWHEAPLAGASVTRLTVVIVSGLRDRGDLFGRYGVLGRVGQPGVRAYVAYNRVLRFASGCHTNTAKILGAVMAHEIGHLLLGEGHSATGLMAATVDARPSADLRFTPEQVLALRAILLRDDDSHAHGALQLATRNSDAQPEPVVFK
jgi:hypothetical protein